MTGLTANTSYTYKLVATDGPNLVNSNISFTTLVAPVASIISATATGVTQTTATLNGVVNPNGTTINVWYQDQNGNTLPGSQVNGITGIGNVTLPPFSLTGLTANTSYTYKLVATDGPNLVNSNISFTTLAVGGGGGCGLSPSITLLSPNSVTAGAGATLVTVTGNNFVNGTSSALFNGTARTTNVLSPISLTISLTVADTTTAGTGNITVANGGCTSGSSTFTINPIGGGGGGGGGGGIVFLPTVITQNATNVINISATLGGSINPDGSPTTAWFEYNTSSTLAGTPSETVHTSQGTASVVSSLIQNITGLTPNTTYYFRAVANNSYGTVKGNILSFQTTTTTTPATTNTTTPTNGSTSLNGVITTIQATQKTSTSAKLNGLFINQNGSATTGYFQYGKTSALNLSTPQKSLGTAASISFSEVVTNLTPNTIYYFRAVAVNQGVIHDGNILVFQTPNIVLVTDNTNTIPTAGDGSNVNVINSMDNVPVINDTNNSSQDYSGVATAKLGITTTKEKLAVGDEVDYSVTFENVASKNLENIKLTVQLPSEIDFTESDLGTLESNNIVTFDIKALAPNQTSTMTIKGKVNSNASLQNVLVTTAVASYNVTGSSLSKDEISYVTNSVTTGTGLEANSIFALSSLPRLIGWLFLILAIIALAIIGRKLYITHPKA